MTRVGKAMASGTERLRMGVRIGFGNTKRDLAVIPKDSGKPLKEFKNTT